MQGESIPSVLVPLPAISTDFLVYINLTVFTKSLGEPSPQVLLSCSPSSLCTALWSMLWVSSPLLEPSLGWGTRAGAGRKGSPSPTPSPNGEVSQPCPFYWSTQLSLFPVNWKKQSHAVVPSATINVWKFILGIKRSCADPSTHGTSALA